MSKDLMQKAAKMVINGAAILSEPCPYCKGVRVMKDGNALCVNCGKEPKQKSIKKEPKQKSIKKEPKQKSVSALSILEKKLKKLSHQLEKENNPTKQQELIKTIDSLIGIIGKLKAK